MKPRAAIGETRVKTTAHSRGLFTDGYRWTPPPNGATNMERMRGERNRACARAAAAKYASLHSDHLA